MALTQLSDIVKPEYFSEYFANNSMTSTALFLSGVMVPNSLMQAQLSMGGNILDIPAWGDLVSPADAGGSDPNISNDDPTDLSTPNKVGAVNQKVRKSYLNNSWSAASLAGEIAGSDPIRRIAERVNEYWNRTYEYRLIKSLIGVLLSNAANNSSDMVIDISAATSEDPVAINGTDYTSPAFTRNAVLDAAFTMGDRMSDFRAIAVHSAVFYEMSKNNEIDYVRDSDNNILFPSYAGLAVLQDDSLKISSGVYVSILFGGASVGFAQGEPADGFGVEVFRKPDGGHGGGVSTLYTRRNSIIHPAGFSFISGSVAGNSPTSAELALAGNWVRIAPDRKHVPIAFLVTA